MTRTQISMDREMLREARRKASEQRISLAEYVRRLVAADLDETIPRADVSSIFGLFKSAEPTDIARDKDALIGEAVLENRRK